MASVVGKTIFSDGKGKLFFGYYKDNDAVEFVDYKTWKKLSFKDVSKGDTNKERVIKAIVKKQKQFNKKVDFNMWAKQKKRTFEETMDWFIKNGWINNINKGGIREGIEDVLSVNEGKKRFKRQDGIGKAKYTISYHDGKKKHKDGSDFFDIKIFKNKKDLSDFVGTLVKQGYKLTNESVNEYIEPQTKKIAYYTGTRPEAVKDFVSKHGLNITKLLKYVEKGGLPQRMELVAALAGKPNNPKQKKIIKTFQESVNERYSGNSKDFKYDLELALDKIGISYKAIKKISKKGKGFEVRMSSYMKNRDAWEKLGKEIGAELVDFKPGSINIGLYESKGEVEQIAKKTKSETAFYDVLSKIEKKYGKRNYRLWLEKSLKDLGVNPKHYDYRTNAAAEEKLYQLTK